MIKTTMECQDISDPTKPKAATVHCEFNPELPLEIQFVFENSPDNFVTWMVARQLVVDGLHAPLLTGLGDMKFRSDVRWFYIRLRGEDSYLYNIRCPREQVLWTIDEAEALAPLASVTMLISDECIADWLAEA